MSKEAYGDERGPEWDSDAVRITEMVLRMPPPFTRGLVVNRPAGGMTYRGRLFQAGMWREYAMTWHGRRTKTGVDRKWCERIGGWTYPECLRRARVNLYLARRISRTRH